MHYFKDMHAYTNSLRHTDTCTTIYWTHTHTHTHTHTRTYTHVHTHVHKHTHTHTHTHAHTYVGAEGLVEWRRQGREEAQKEGQEGGLVCSSGRKGPHPLRTLQQACCGRPPDFPRVWDHKWVYAQRCVLWGNVWRPLDAPLRLVQQAWATPWLS